MCFIFPLVVRDHTFPPSHSRPLKESPALLSTWSECLRLLQSDLSLHQNKASIQGPNTAAIDPTNKQAGEVRFSTRKRCVTSRQKIYMKLQQPWPWEVRNGLWKWKQAGSTVHVVIDLYWKEKQNDPLKILKIRCSVVTQNSSFHFAPTSTHYMYQHSRKHLPKILHNLNKKTKLKNKIPFLVNKTINYPCYSFVPFSVFG